jgi:hypothetical protein
MTKRISERQRWVQVARLPLPGQGHNVQGIIERHNETLSVLIAFAKVGRVVRAERDQYGGIILKARKA